MKASILTVYGGPNGSGKSTITEQHKPTGPYVNADMIQKHLGCTPLEAAENAEKTRELLLAQGESFTMESALSTDRNYDLMQRARSQGYFVHGIYVLTKNPKINMERVAARARWGGHDVPPEKVESRYRRAMSKIPQLFKVCNRLEIFDNSPNRGEGEPTCIVAWEDGTLELFPNSIWSREELLALVEGKYIATDEK